MSSPLENFNLQKKDRWNILTNIPAWEQNGVINWIDSILRKNEVTGVFGETTSYYKSGILLKVQRTNRVMFSTDLGIDIDEWMSLSSDLHDLIKQDDERFIIFLELMIKYVRDDTDPLFYNSSPANRSVVLSLLENRLSNGSRWKVVDKKGSPAGLVERVDSKLTDIAIDLNNRFLDEAWDLAYSLKPDPEKAIEKVQSAIEAIASKNGITTAETKVYGTIIGDIKARKSKSYQTVAKKEFDLSNSLAQAKPRKGFEPIDLNDTYMDWFWNGMDLIQKSNPVHHKSKATSEEDIQVDTARQAVLIGTLFCQLIDSGYIKRTKKTS
jgi:hypothetical protein